MADAQTSAGRHLYGSPLASFRVILSRNDLQGLDLLDSAKSPTAKNFSDMGSDLARGSKSNFQEKCNSFDDVSFVDKGFDRTNIGLHLVQWITVGF
jgi:hypothetical protein